MDRMSLISLQEIINLSIWYDTYIYIMPMIKFASLMKWESNQLINICVINRIKAEFFCIQIELFVKLHSMTKIVSDSYKHIL